MSHTPFALTPASYLLCVRGSGDATEVLLQLRAGTGYYDAHWASGAAGHVEPGETALACMVREAREELGIAVAPEDLELMAVSQRQDAGYPHGESDDRVDFFFVTRSWHGEPAVMEPNKTAHIGWFPVDDLPEPMVPHEAAAIAAICGGGSGIRFLTEGFSDADS